MSQSVLFLALHLVGLLVCLAIGPWRRPALCSALAFPVGLAVVVLLALLLLMVGVPYSGWTLGGAAAAAVAASIISIRRRDVSRRTMAVCAAWTVAFAAVVVPLTNVDLVVMSNDSHIFVMLGKVIGWDGELAPDVFAQLDHWGVFQIVAQSMTELTRQDFLYSLPLVLGLSFIPVFSLTLGQALAAPGATRWRRVAVVALVTAALFTINMVGSHLFYLHTNLSAAVYLTIFAVLFWLGETEGDATYVPVAFISLAAFALQRTETPLAALLFLPLTVLGSSQLPRRSITVWLGVFTAVVGLWYEALAQNLSAVPGFLTPTRCRLVWVALLVFYGWWLASNRRPIARINRWMPAIVAGLVALALAATFIAKPGHMATSAAIWARTLLGLPFWGQAWYAIVALVLLGLLMPAPRFRQVFVIGIPVSFAFILILAVGRIPYRGYVDDSANRMTLHALPLIFWYLGLKAKALLDGGGGREAAG